MKRKSLIRQSLILLALFYLIPLQAQYTMPALPADTTQFGKKISRTLSLLGTSTATNKKKVKVLVYGQSISEQDWWNQVRTWLQTTYPNADLDMRNLAIGGYSSQMLWRTCEMDVANFYPDLVIFHVYGNHYFYESLMRFIRGRTAAEILVQTDHIGGGENTLSLTDMSNWSNHMCFEVIPGYAATYGMEVIDTRTQWKNYLTLTGLTSSQLTTDGTHLNAQGCFVQAQLTQRHLVYKGKNTADPNGLCTILEVGKDVTISGGKITLPFTGNKIEIIPTEAKALKLYVKVDGKKPSDFPTCYNITRPCLSGSFWNGGFTAKSSITRSVVQNWSLDFTSANAFTVTGTKTGPDGSGNSGTRFVSNSGQVVIQPKDWWPTSPWKFSAGSKVQWSSFAMFADTLDCTSITVTANYENPINLVQGLPNGSHTLELSSSTGEFPIKYIKVYKPAYTLSLTTNKDTIKTGSIAGTSTVSVTTNTFWQVWDTIPWITVNAVDNYSATDDLRLFDSQSITLTLSANSTGKNRTGVIYLSGIGVNPKPIVVVQSVYTLLKDAELLGRTYGNASFTLTNDATGKTVVYSSSNTGVATISGSTVTITGAGTTTITAQIQGDASSLITKTLTVAKKSLAVSTPNVSREEGAANPLFAINYSGFVNGDDESDLDSKPVVTCAATTGSKTGTYPIVVGSGSDNNYSLTYTNGTLTVTYKIAIPGIENVISLYPNPASDVVTIENVTGAAMVTIAGMNGTIVKEISTLSGTFSVAGIQKGLYIVTISTDKQIVVEKLLVE